jgi:NADH-quinone oxidoreductase subunit J
MINLLVFVVAGAIVLGGAVGVVTMSNPVHAALSLVATLFGVAVLFVAQDAHFLAAVQVIVYAGAIVVLFLFVIMLLGVDRSEDLRVEPLAGQRPGAAVAGVGILGAAIATLLVTRGHEINGVKQVVTGVHTAGGTAIGTDAASADDNVHRIGSLLFTNYLFAFEATSILLVIAVIGAVVLARRPKGGDGPEASR